MSTPPKVPTKMSSCKSTSRSNSPASPIFDDKAPIIMVAKTPKPETRKCTGFTHNPRLPLLAWLIISLPLIVWDTLYVFLRPYTMPGGKLHSPIWTPYALYGSVDYIYGWPAWNNHNGFTAAQSAMNIPESVFYCWYLYIVALQVVNRRYEGMSQLEVKGKGVNLAMLVCFSGAVMTVSKSLLYCESHFLGNYDDCIS